MQRTTAIFSLLTLAALAWLATPGSLDQAVAAELIVADCGECDGDCKNGDKETSLRADCGDCKEGDCKNGDCKDDEAQAGVLADCGECDGDCKDGDEKESVLADCGDCKDGDCKNDDNEAFIA